LIQKLFLNHRYRTVDRWTDGQQRSFWSFVDFFGWLFGNWKTEFPVFRFAHVFGGRSEFRFCVTTFHFSNRTGPKTLADRVTNPGPCISSNGEVRIIGSTTQLLVDYKKKLKEAKENIPSMSWSYLYWENSKWWSCFSSLYFS
jgi:hypothetical protein